MLGFVCGMLRSLRFQNFTSSFTELKLISHNLIVLFFECGPHCVVIEGFTTPRDCTFVEILEMKMLAFWNK
jgi:hypothetical protein